MTVRLNALWGLFGIPFSCLSALYYVYAYCFKGKVELKGKVVFITGASSGLGAACAEVFHEAGCKLVLSGRQVQNLLQLKERLMKKKVEGGDAHAIVTMDLSDLDSIEEKVKEAIAAFGRVDVLINNAGMSYRGEAYNTNLSVHKTLMTVNYLGQVELTRACLAHMIPQKSGHILAVSSVQGKLAIPHRTAYAASKHALEAYFDSLRPEVAQHNIFVSVVSPYYIATDLSKNALTSAGTTYGKMDKETSAGLTPRYVAEQIAYCIQRRQDDQIVAPFHCHAAIALRHMAPWLFNIIMDFRARGERAAMRKEH